MEDLLSHISHFFDIKIQNPDLFKTAFRHTSFVNEYNARHRQEKLESNERLEYLGDAVLELLVSQFLFDAYPDQPEGFLSRTRASLVQEEALAKLAKLMKFDVFIQLGKGEKASGGQYRFSILADCFEAFLGALYLDQGLNRVKKLLDDYLLKDHQAFLKEIHKDYKTLLQEKLQAEGQADIQYQLVKESGPDHARVFEMALYLNGQCLAKGQGRSKKQAEMQAAKTAYLNLKK